MTISFILDPTAENVGTELDINAAPYTVTGFEFPTPPRTPQYASSVDSDGDTLYANRYANRTVTLKLLIRASTDALLTTAITNLQQKAGKINRDAVLNRNGVGGVLKYVTPDGKTRKFDVCEMGADPAFEKTFTARQFIEGTLTFTCLPFWRGDETALSDHAETSLPWLTFTETTVDGDVPALLRLVVDDDQGVDQGWAIAAVRNRFRTSALTDRLFYQAESLTLQGAGASSSTAASGYSGSGAVRATTLSTSLESVVSTQMTTAALTSVTGSDSTDIFTKASHGLTNDTRVRLSAKTGGSNLSTTTDYYVVNASTGFQLATTIGGTPVDLGSDVSSVTVTPQKHLTHVGTYRVFARVQAPSANTGTVSVALEWALGDFRRPTRNASVYLTDTRLSSGTPVEAAWLYLDLGLVRIPVGTSQWEGRVLGASTVAGDDVYVDYLQITPADEGLAQVSGASVQAAPTAYTARSDFSTESGAPTGDSLLSGGSWAAPASAYETDDFAVGAGTWLQRSTAGADTNTNAKYGRWIYVGGSPGTGSMTDQAVQISVQLDDFEHRGGVVARAVDKDNFLVAYVRQLDPGYTTVGTAYVEKYTTAGGKEVLWSGPSGTYGAGSTAQYALPRLAVMASGLWTLSIATGIPGDRSSQTAMVPIASGYHADLATGGTLASGAAGVFDWAPSTGYGTARYYGADGQFLVWVPVSDAACFASRSIQFGSSACVRQDTGGTYWVPVSTYEGDYLFCPSGGQEGRTTEFLVKMCRSNPYTGTDSAIDDLSARPYVTPRGLVV